MPYLRFVLDNLRFLAFGFALAFFSSFGQTFFISLSGEGIRETFALSHGDFGLCYSLATLASGCSIIWLGSRIDTLDLRLFSALICAGLVAACFGLALAPGVLLLGVALFLLRLFGQGLLSHTAMTSMSRYFDEDRGKAMSVAGLGFPAGEAALPVVTVLVIAAAGWRTTWMMLGALLGVAVLPLVLVLLRGHAARHAAHVAALAHESAAEARRPEATRRRQWTRRDVLRDPRFYLVLPAVIAPGFIVTGLFFHQAHLVAEKGWAMTWFAACFAAYAGAQLPASLAAGPLVDRIGAVRLLPYFLLPLALSLVVLAGGRHPGVAPAFMLLAGVTGGLAGPVVGAMWAEVYGVEHLGAIRAMVTAILVVGTAISPVGMGRLIDAGVTMDVIAWMACAYVAVGVVLARTAMRSAA